MHHFVGFRSLTRSDNAMVGKICLSSQTSVESILSFALLFLQQQQLGLVSSFVSVSSSYHPSIYFFARSAYNNSRQGE
jgi:hypothetical protein